MLNNSIKKICILFFFCFLIISKTVAQSQENYHENLELACALYLTKKEIPENVLLCLTPKTRDNFSLLYNTTHPETEIGRTDFFYDITQHIFNEVLLYKNIKFYDASLQLASFADGEFAEGFNENLEKIINLNIKKFCKTIKNKEYRLYNPMKYYSEFYKCN